MPFRYGSPGSRTGYQIMVKIVQAADVGISVHAIHAVRIIISIVFCFVFLPGLVPLSMLRDHEAGLDAKTNKQTHFNPPINVSEMWHLGQQIGSNAHKGIHEILAHRSIVLAPTPS